MRQREAKIYANAIELVSAAPGGFVLVSTADNDDRPHVNPLCYMDFVNAEQDIGSTDAFEWTVNVQYRSESEPDVTYQFSGIQKVTMRLSEWTVYIHIQSFAGIKFVCALTPHKRTRRDAWARADRELQTCKSN